MNNCLLLCSIHVFYNIKFWLGWKLLLFPCGKYVMPAALTKPPEVACIKIKCFLFNYSIKSTTEESYQRPGLIYYFIYM